MENSIEAIWKEGFLKSNALVVPKLNNLYNQKSMHIIDKLKRMFKINMNAVIVGALLFLGISFLIGIPITGIGFFITLSIIVVINKRLSFGLAQIDMSESSYDYLKAFDSWLKKQINVNRKMARFYYPAFFLSVIVGFWNSNFNGKWIKDLITTKLILFYPDISLTFGIPTIFIISVIFIIVLLSYFGDKIYNWDLNIVYGNMLKKLAEIITDMEELSKEQ